MPDRLSPCRAFSSGVRMSNPERLSLPERRPNPDRRVLIGFSPPSMRVSPFRAQQFIKEAHRSEQRWPNKLLIRVAAPHRRHRESSVETGWVAIAARPRISSVLHPMDHGRVVKVSRMGQPPSVYVVAVEHPQKAIDIVAANVGQ